jgi:phosphoglycerate dehydrogenase-like enzyme
MSMRVLLHCDVGPTLAARLAALQSNELTIVSVGARDEAAYQRAAPEAEVLWHLLTPVDAARIARSPKLQLIQKIGVGVNTIDLDCAKERGIAVCNMPGTNTRAVAEMTLALMFAALRRLKMFDASVRSGQWAPSAQRSDGIGEIGGSTVGLVGYGAVPQLIAPMLTALQARVLHFARRRVAAPGEWRTLDDLLAESDIVSLHLPLTADTERLIDERRLGLMKRGAILINTARGGLVDQPALVAALRAGQLGGAGLDVLAVEPPDEREAMFALDNVVLAPHVAWLTDQTWERSLEVALENCRRLAAGETLAHRVV